VASSQGVVEELRGEKAKRSEMAQVTAQDERMRENERGREEREWHLQVSR
jgi:hypothetical protein